MRPLWFTLLICTVAGCHGGTTPIEVRNQSGRELRNIHLSGPGFTAAIALLGPGESETVWVDPKGEAGLAMKFEVGTQHVETPEQGYFETGYDVTATIGKDLKVDVDGEM